MTAVACVWLRHEITMIGMIMFDTLQADRKVTVLVCATLRRTTTEKKKRGGS